MLRLLLPLVVLTACSTPAPAPEPAGPREPAVADAAALLAGTWARGLSEEAAAVEAVLDGPTGTGWIALYHGDLGAAEGAFAAVLASSPTSGAARLGLARVHLARAEAFDVAWALHRDAARALAGYRAEHRDRVRLGPYERGLARLLFAPEPPPTDAGGVPTTGGDPALLAAIDALGPDRATRAPPAGLPAAWTASLAFARAVEGGDLGAAAALEPSVRSGEPDLRDPLGVDEQTGLTFDAPFYDPLRLRSLTLYHAAAALRVGGALPGVGEGIAAWAARFGATGAADGADDVEAVPSALLTFGGPWLDREDALHPSGDAPTAFGARLTARLPQWFATPPDPGAIDRELRAVDALETAAAEALGPGLATELGAPRLFADAILRRRMVALVAAEPTLALRLGRRSLDANPGSLGGAADSSRTRVSWRNDRAFLLRLARTLWEAGQPGAALDLVHPLAQEDRALQPVVHYLGQLDAASSVGTAGKASQL